MLPRSLRWFTVSDIGVFAIAISAMALTAVPSSASVSVDYDKAIDFTTYRTYSWGEGTPAEPAFVERRIVAAVDRELAAAGLRKVDEEGDLRVVTHASVETQQRVDIDDFPYWYRWHREPQWGASTIYVKKIEVGTLIVDLVDIDSDQLVWRALGKGSVGDPNKNEKRINKAAKKMFKNFPPE